MPNIPGSPDNKIGFPEFSITNPASMIPTYGNWCGPSWAAGQRITAPITRELIERGLNRSLLD